VCGHSGQPSARTRGPEGRGVPERRHTHGHRGARLLGLEGRQVHSPGLLEVDRLHGGGGLRGRMRGRHLVCVCVCVRERERDSSRLAKCLAVLKSVELVLTGGDKRRRRPHATVRKRGCGVRAVAPATHHAMAGVVMASACDAITSYLPSTTRRRIKLASPLVESGPRVRVRLQQT